MGYWVGGLRTGASVNFPRHMSTSRCQSIIARRQPFLPPSQKAFPKPAFCDKVRRVKASSIALLLLAALSTLACGGPPPPAPHAAAPALSSTPPCPTAAASTAPPPTPPPFPDASERKALFNELVAATRKYHIFSEHATRAFNDRWDDHLPELESAFAQATQPALLRDALSRFGNSLRDGHAGFQPTENGEDLELGLRLEVEWVQGSPRFYIAEIKADTLRTSLHPGDILVSAAGIPADQLLSVHALRSRATSHRRLANDIAVYLTMRSTATSATVEGSEETYRFQHRDGGNIDIALRWRKVIYPPREELLQAQSGEGIADDGSIIYNATQCAPDLREPNYGAAYKLSARGLRLCVYTSGQAPYDAYPIVRHYSFRYLGFFKGLVRPAYLNPPYSRGIVSDYYLLSRTLRERRNTRGIILDLRDNMGGQDGEWFLDWYAPGPYTDIYTSIPQLPDYADAEFRKRVINLGDDPEWFPWYQQQIAKLPRGEPVRKMYQCVDAACGMERRLTPSHGLLAVPVALLVGPQTGSAAAHVAMIFDENDFGPLIGDVTGASFTLYRLEHPVKTGGGVEWGTMRFALTSEMSGKTGATIEGKTPQIDYPVERTFERQVHWDEDLVAAALQGFRSYRFPKHAGRLGP